jgi:hypothetical protein
VIAAQAAAKLQIAMPPSTPITLQGFSSKDSLFATITNNSTFNQCSRVVLSAIFDDAGGYQILIDAFDVDIFSTSNNAQDCRAYWGDFNAATNTASSPFQSGSSCSTMDYFSSLFVAAQVAIDSALFSATFTPNFYVAPMLPFKQVLGEGIISAVSLYLVLGLSYYGTKFCVAVVAEKEMKIRDGMRMMGCSSFMIYSSWMCTTVLSQLPVVVIFTIALNVAKIIYQSNGLLLFITMFLFIISQTAQYVLLRSFTC